MTKLKHIKTFNEIIQNQDIIVEKFTFNTESPTGRYKSFYSDIIIIKWNKKEIGNISPTEPYTIKLMVLKDDMKNDKNKNCDWKWITLSKKFDSLEDSKKWINDNFDKITTSFKLKLL